MNGVINRGGGGRRLVCLMMMMMMSIQWSDTRLKVNGEQVFPFCSISCPAAVQSAASSAFAVAFLLRHTICKRMMPTVVKACVHLHI